MKIVSLIILTSLFIGSLSLTKFEFDTLRMNCKNQNDIHYHCDYNIAQNNVDNVQCSKELYTSYICYTSFSNCMNLDDNDEVPLVCWLCWVQSPAKSEFYLSFQKCMNDKVFDTHLMIYLGLLTVSMMAIWA